MILAGVLLQVALATATSPAALRAPAETLVIRHGERTTAIPVTRSEGVPLVPADLVAAPLGGGVRALGKGRHTLTAHGTQIELIERIPFASVDGDVVPLASAPFADARRLLVPLQLIADVLPRAASNLAFDPVRNELRVFAGAVATGRPATTSPAKAPGGATAASAPSAKRTRAGAVRLTRRHRIVVDAGHGGPDGGMSGPIKGEPKIREKNITLEVAKLVAEELERRGIDAVMTRTTDTLIALADRGRIANESKADLFLSIHVNAANMKWKDPGAARGFETYFLAEAKTEDAKRVEAMENSSVRFETGAYAPRGDPLSFIINDMAQNEHLREASELAAQVQSALGAIHPSTNRGVKQANFAVLRTSFMPAVLIEIGFGTNAAEAKYISDAAKQKAMAGAIADAALEYLAGYERRTGVAQP